MNQFFTVPLEVIRTAIVSWWDNWSTWVLLGLLWLLSWITIVLGPPATFGIYHFANEATEAEAPNIRVFFEGIKRYFLVSWSWFLLTCLLLYIVIVNINFYTGFGKSWAGFLQGFFIIIGLLWIGIQSFTIPFLMLQENKSILKALRNSVVVALTTPAYTLVIWLVYAVSVVLSVILLIPLFLGVQGLVAMIGCQAIHERVDTFEKQKR